ITPLDDVWRLIISTGQWKYLSPAKDHGKTPGARYGFAFDVDLGNDGDTNAALPKMLIYGGLSAGGYSDSLAWSLSLPRNGDVTNSVAWKRETTSGGPGPREGHAATMDGLRDQRNGQLLQR